MQVCILYRCKASKAVDCWALALAHQLATQPCDDSSPSGRKIAVGAAAATHVATHILYMRLATFGVTVVTHESTVCSARKRPVLADTRL